MFFIKILDKREKKIGVFFSLGILYFLLAFQFGVGYDYFSYIEIFKGEQEFNSIRGNGFLFYINFLKVITNKEIIFFITSSFIQTVLLYNFLMKLYRNKYIEKIEIYLFILITTTYFLFSLFNTIRSTISSLCFANIFLNYITLKKIKITSILYLFIAAMFHSSFFIGGLLIIIFYAIAKLKCLRKNRMIIYLFICFLLYKIKIIKIIIKFILESNINFYYKYYLESSMAYSPSDGSGVISIIMLMAYILSLIEKKNQTNVEKEYFLNMGVLIYGVSLIINESPILNRLMEYLILFQIFPLQYLMENLETNKLLKVLKMMFLILCLLILLKKIFYKPTREYVYKSIIFNKLE
ncbi:EpsG family protein [Cetobacterium sp. ZWU0022]|uniref:EpsG family protein n=1 Tax=Cetobacterium sp. ZWU0022 TaxID=1340502 RepID=UPI001E33CF44|nr:EpsG family protein [Cetobacterium sp. ZWU0022]